MRYKKKCPLQNNIINCQSNNTKRSLPNTLLRDSYRYIFQADNDVLDYYEITQCEINYGISQVIYLCIVVNILGS